MLTRTILTGAGLVMMTASFASSANAQTYSVSFSRTEIASQHGAEQLYKHIRNVAYEVCRDEFKGERFVKRRLEMQRCVKSVSRELVGKVNHAQLDQIVAGKSNTYKQYASK
ncbi:MAG: hypothetical protein COA69_06760 [Robiginitomaculum sp.]|nr:MAG: hypothetical protein COA69_06760 [Robiginitomaculum sp.]